MSLSRKTDRKIYPPQGATPLEADIEFAHVGSQCDAADLGEQALHGVGELFRLDPIGRRRRHGQAAAGNRVDLKYLYTFRKKCRGGREKRSHSGVNILI